MSDNVIIFPKGKKGSPPQSLEETMAEIQFAREEKIDSILSELIPFILYSLSDVTSVDIYSNEYSKDNALFFESLKSLLYKCYGIDHPFHKLANAIIQTGNINDSGFDYTFDISLSDKDTLS